MFTVIGLRWRLCLWLCLLLGGLPMGVWAADLVPAPELRTPVTDLTQTLTPEQVGALDTQLRALQTRKGSQLAILLVPTTAPEAIEQYSIRVAEAWKLGRKDTDDGVLLLVAKNDRAVRIEVGYGLEGVLNDATTNRIIRQLIAPQFRAGNYYQGISDASTRLIQLIDGEVLPEPANSTQSTQQRGTADKLPWPLLIFGVLVAGRGLRSLFGRFGAAGVTAGGAGVLVWLFVGSILAGLMAAFFAFVFVLSSGQTGGWNSGRRGGWGGGRFGGGGFGGGGGGFGGGGASGRW